MENYQKSVESWRDELFTTLIHPDTDHYALVHNDYRISLAYRDTIGGVLDKTRSLSDYNLISFFQCGMNRDKALAFVKEYINYNRDALEAQIVAWKKAS